MPNWSDNKLFVEGDKKDIKRFRENNKTSQSELSLNCLIPMPKEIQETTSPCKPNEKLIKKYGVDNWYDWACKNWGTKWDAQVWSVKASDESLLYDFRSAWTPPIEWLKTVSKLFPKMLFKIEFESFMLFEGVAYVKNGKISLCCDKQVLSEKEDSSFMKDPEANYLKAIKGSSNSVTRGKGR